MPYRFERVHPEASTHRRSRQPPVRAKSDRRASQEAAVRRVSALLGDRFAWFLSPVRIKAIAEDLRVLHRQRDLDLGIVVVAVILSAFSRSSDTEGRVRDAFAIYREIDTTISVADEAFRKAMMRSAEVLLHLLLERTQELAKREGLPPLRGRLSFFTDLVSTDATSFKLASALADGLPGSGSSAALKLHGVYSERAQVATSVEATEGSAHDSPHFRPVWLAGVLYLWDLGYNDYARVVEAHLAGAFFVQRLKDKANVRMLAWYDAEGKRHLVPRGPRGGLPHMNEVLEETEALHHGGALDLDIVLDGKTAEGDPAVCVLRVVCVPTEGQDRYYLTDLPREHFSPCDVAELYGARWEVELLYKDWQGGCRLDEVTRLSNLDTLRAVIYGGLLAHLLSREVAQAANDRAKDERRACEAVADDSVTNEDTSEVEHVAAKEAVPLPPEGGDAQGASTTSPERREAHDATPPQAHSEPFEPEHTVPQPQSAAPATAASATVAFPP
jgi:hypothetical protein